VEARDRVPKGEIPGGAKARRGSASADRETGDAGWHGSPDGSLPWSRDCSIVRRFGPQGRERWLGPQGNGRKGWNAERRTGQTVGKPSEGRSSRALPV